jgi:uncharacterized protein
MAASITSDLLARLKERADAEAISVFSRNLKDLLLAAPAGPRATMGLDPGFRTGVKVAVVDQTGKLVDTDTIYPHEPKSDWRGALATLAALCMKHKVDLVSVGNGTASRETDKLVAELIAKMPNLKLTKVMVSEAGACRIRWPSWSRSSPRRSALGSTSTTLTSPGSPAPSTPWWRTASTPWAWM